MENRPSIQVVVYRLNNKFHDDERVVDIKVLMNKYIHFILKTQNDVDKFKSDLPNYPETEGYPVEITTEREYWTCQIKDIRHITHSHQDLTDEIFSNLDVRATELVIGKYLLVIVKNEKGKLFVENLFPDFIYDGYPLEILINKRPTLFGNRRNINWKSYGFTEDGMIACDLCEGKKKVHHFDGCPGCGSTGYLLDVLKFNAEYENHKYERSNNDFKYLKSFIEKTSQCKTCKGVQHKTMGGCPCEECGLLGTQPWGG